MLEQDATPSLTVPLLPRATSAWRSPQPASYLSAITAAAILQKLLDRGIWNA